MKLIPYLLLLVLLPGCLTLYKPNSINSPQLSQQGEFSGTVAFGASGCGLLNLQTAYAPGENFGLMLNGMYHTTNTSRGDSSTQSLEMLFGEFGAGFFQPINKQSFIQVYGGFGLGQTTGEITGESKLAPEIKANYFNIFMQPGIFLTSRYATLAVDFRLNYVRFYHLDVYKYNSFEWWDTDFGPRGVSACDFLIAEPTVTLKVGSENLKLMLQGGITIPVVNKDSYFDINTSSVWGLPMFKFTFGVCFNFGNSRSSGDQDRPKSF